MKPNSLQRNETMPNSAYENHGHHLWEKHSSSINCFPFYKNLKDLNSVIMLCNFYIYIQNFRNIIARQKLDIEIVPVCNTPKSNGSRAAALSAINR